MVNKDIIAIKDNILNTVGDSCEKIILFGSHAYGIPDKNSDYDFYVVLKDGTEKPVLVLQETYCNLCDTKHIPVDILANYKTRFEWRKTQPTMERTISNKGIVLYERH